jgi:hypothetical protein
LDQPRHIDRLLLSGWRSAAPGLEPHLLYGHLPLVVEVAEEALDDEVAALFHIRPGTPEVTCVARSRCLNRTPGASRRYRYAQR